MFRIENGSDMRLAFLSFENMLGQESLLVLATAKKHCYFDNCICHLASFPGPNPAFGRLQNCNY